MPKKDTGGRVGKTKPSVTPNYTSLREGPGLTTSDLMGQAAVRSFAERDRFTPMDLAYETSEFFEDTARDIASIPSGLLGILDVLNTGATPGMVLEDTAAGLVDQYSDPLQYADEHPGFFMMDLLGLMGAASKAGQAAKWADARLASGAEAVAPETIMIPKPSALGELINDPEMLAAAQGHPRDWVPFLRERARLAPRNDAIVSPLSRPGSLNYIDAARPNVDEVWLSDAVTGHPMGGNEIAYAWRSEDGTPQAMFQSDLHNPSGGILQAIPGAPPEAVPELLTTLAEKFPVEAAEYLNNPDLALELSAKGAHTLQRLLRPEMIERELIKPPAKWPGLERLLGEEAGAIGPIGRRLEAGDVRTEEVLATGQRPSTAITATIPEIVNIGEDPAIFKRTLGSAEPFNWHPHAKMEAPASELNRMAGSRLRMPGVQYGEFEHTPYTYVPSKSTYAGREPGYFVGGPKRVGPGSLIEFVEDLVEIDDPNVLNWANPEVRDQTRAMNIFDYVIGNNDRSFGSNFYATPDFRSDDFIPVAVDQGASFYPVKDIDTQYSPQAWARDLDDIGNFTHDMPGFTGDELNWIQRLIFSLKNPGPYLSMLEPSQLQAAINRAMQIYRDQKLKPAYWDEGW